MAALKYKVELNESERTDLKQIATFAGPVASPEDVTEHFAASN